MDLSKTVNLPRTDFSMKANLPLTEPEIVDFWKENRVYQRALKRRQDGEYRVLHDGPPYSNGKIHLGHALNKILKDIVVKYWTLRGYYSPFIPGWDTHGLPNEKAAISTYNIDRKKVSPSYIREKSKEIAMYYSEIQREQFKRLGVFADWDNPYLTLNPSYEANIIRAFGLLAKNGYIYRDLKPVYWCYECETSLADAEIEYKQKKSPSIVVSFKVLDEFVKNFGDYDELYAVIWTTTPWTLPANVAIAYKPESLYLIVEYNQKKYIVAKEAYHTAPQLAFIRSESRILSEFKSERFENLKVKHPFMGRESVFVPAEYVDLSNGTGLVHIAPGHGYEDYAVGKRFNLEVLSPVDHEGKFTSEVKFLEGVHIEQANQVIIDTLKNNGNLVFEDQFEHSYPHCWRCHKPVLFRSTYQWFLDVEKMRNELIGSVDQVEWYPEWGAERMKKMIENRPDWCLSRQRVWGVFIPVIYCKKCHDHILDYELIENIASIVEKEGSDIWWSKDVKYFITKNTKCSRCGSREFEKEKDIFDVWFESAVSHFAVLKGINHPCELYLEGADQYRGWFQVSLITSVGILGKPPYKKVLTHGWVLDQEGRAMHKSLGNVIDPMEIVEQYGADILRLYFASSEYTNDIKMSYSTINLVAEMYKKIRNTIRFMLGNIYDFDVSAHNFDINQLPILEKYILWEHSKMLAKIQSYIDNFEFHRYVYTVYEYIVHELSSFYLDIRKDILYTYDVDSFERRACQFVIFNILRDLLIVLFPVLSFTCEQAWRNIPMHNISTFSCYLQDWPLAEKYKISENLEFYQKLISIYKNCQPIFEKYKNKGVIKTLNESIMKIYCEQDYSFIVSNVNLLKEMMRVAEIQVYQKPEKEIDSFVIDGIGFFVEFEKSNYHKCGRCWNYYKELKDYTMNVCDRCYSVLQTKGVVT
ncbi:MAG: isoleucine--tRNA ligase [bacterium]